MSCVYRLDINRDARGVKREEEVEERAVHAALHKVDSVHNYVEGAYDSTVMLGLIHFSTKMAFLDKINCVPY